MIETLTEAIQPPNLFATAMLGLILCYWLFVIIGFLGVDAFDIDLDVDADMDPGLDGDFDGGHFFGDVLHFFHLGEVPLMILLSLFFLFHWVVTLLSNHYLNPTLSGFVTLYLLLPNILVCLLITKAVIMPFIPLFRTEDDELELARKLVGRSGVITTSEVTDSFGQASINIDGPPLTLHVRAGQGCILKKGDPVTVVDYKPDSNTYVVQPMNLEK